MKVDPRIAFPAALAAMAFVIPASSSADTLVYNCPDHYHPVLAAASPSKDKNGDTVICQKDVDNHTNTVDDKGVDINPADWSANPDDYVDDATDPVAP